MGNGQYMKPETQTEKTYSGTRVFCTHKHIKSEWSREEGDGKLSVLWCRDCGLGRLKPFPTAEELTRLYSRHPVYGLGFRNESHGGFPTRIKRLSELFPQRGRLLDVGSGLGYFLKIAQDDGWDVDGIEPRSAAVKYCYNNFGIKVHKGFLEDFEKKPGTYQVITLWDVLEHVYDPLQFLERSIELLAPGGILVVAIPNASGWPARIFKGRWRYVMPVHLYYFKMPYIDHFLSSYNMRLERADHTVKIHSLIQGVMSLLPFKVSQDRVFRIGIKDNGRQAGSDQSTQSAAAKTSPLQWARKLAFRFNMLSLPVGIGDMVDLYCRKGR
jgi:2-polyprenyl-3-methyl-5-hydroxy-6-metoxy-1,4-benzoquinol methylase